MVAAARGPVRSHEEPATYAEGVSLHGDLLSRARTMMHAREHRLDLPRWLIRRPVLALGIGASEAAEAFSGKVDYRLKLLAQSQVAAMVGCEFCIDIGSALAHEAGIAERKLCELHEFETSDAFDETERLVLRFASVLTATPIDVPAELRDRLVELLGKAALVELAAAIAHEHERTRLYLALGIRPAKFAADGVCRIPAMPRIADPRTLPSGRAPSAPERRTGAASCSGGRHRAHAASRLFESRPDPEHLVS